MTKSLIAKIHIAKKQLGLDDETYRDLLSTATNGKTSCSKMNAREMTAVLEVLKTKGFKPKKAKTSRRQSPPSGKAHCAEADKITAIWITMHKQGFVRDGSAPALDAYVRRMSAKLNKGAGVSSVLWLNSYMAGRILEMLKLWHKRELIKWLHGRSIFQVRKEGIMGFYYADVKSFTYDELKKLYDRAYTGKFEA